MTWPQDAYVGQKVVCIRVGDYAVQPNVFFSDTLALNATYEISDIKVYGDKIFIDVKELSPGLIWPRWMISRFRPVQSTETGMTTLRKALKSVDTKIKEDA